MAREYNLYDLNSLQFIEACFVAYINVGKIYCKLKNVYSAVVECSTNRNKVNYLINLFKFSIYYRFPPVISREVF